MKQLLLIGILSLVTISCKKQTVAPQQIVQSNSIVSNCDTITCIGAQSQGTYTFTAKPIYTSTDTIFTNGKVRLTYERFSDSTAIGTSGAYEQFDWYNVSCSNFDSRVMTTDQTKIRLRISKTGIYGNVTFYTKSGKTARFRSEKL